MIAGLYIILTIFFLGFILYIPCPWIIGRMLKQLQKKRAVSLRSVFLTFDDGPGNRLTPLVLSKLKEKGIKATFFILGRNISGREEILKSIIKDGHCIASHSYSHVHAWRSLPWKSISDMKLGWKHLSNSLGAKETKYPYRPPYGKMNILSLLCLWIYRIPVLFWTIDCLDTWPEHKRNINYASDKLRTEEGGIVLFHDFDRATDHMDNYVLNSLDAVIDAGKKLGLNFATIDQLY